MTEEEFQATKDRLDADLEKALGRIDRRGSLLFMVLTITMGILATLHAGYAPGLALTALISLSMGIRVRQERARRAANNAYYRLTGERLSPTEKVSPFNRFVRAFGDRRAK